MSDPKLELLKKTADLARLELSEADAEALAPQFDAILAHFEILAGVDVKGVPPTLGATDLSDVKRPDLAGDSGPLAELLENSPDPREGLFGVPKTIGGTE